MPTRPFNRWILIGCLFLFFSPCGILSGQGLYVRGQVKTPEGEALPGVNILIQGTSMGTITDLDGNYACYVPGPKATLVFSSVGFKTQVLQVNNQELINVIMMVDIKALEEVVVIGYTTEELKKITSSIVKLDPREIQTIPVSNVAEQLSGRAPGVFVVNSGMPGGSVKVRIRGFSTINDNNPLYIVDGIPVDANWIKFLNTFDIESIQVLKDAAAASIYGARASNGVILITTMQGKPTGESHFGFAGFTGVQVVPRNSFPEMLGPAEVAMVEKISMENVGKIPYSEQYSLSDGSWGLPDYLFPPAHSIALDGPVDESEYDQETNPITRANKEGTDWPEEISEPALIHNYNLAAYGGSNLAQYALSFGYFNQEGIVIHTGYQKYTGRINATIHVRNRLHIGENFGLAYERSKNNAFSDGDGWSILSKAFWLPTIQPVYDIAGNYTGSKIPGCSSHPYATLTRNKDNFRDLINLMGSIFLDYEISGNLRFKTSFNPNFILIYKNKRFTPTADENYDSGINRLDQSDGGFFEWSWYNTLIFNKQFREKHNLNLLAGTEAIQNETNYMGASRTNFSFEDLNYRYLSTGEQNRNNWGNGEGWSMFSVFGKVDYDYLGKYLVSGTVRYDGSSRFGKDNRFATFPAVSAGWRLSEENFMKSVPSIDNLMLRASWGQTGNQNIGNYRIYDAYMVNTTWLSYPIKGDINQADPGMYNSVLGNPDMKWETTTSLDFGIDLSLFENRIDLKFDWYQRKTSGMLIEIMEPAIYGIGTPPYGNIGDMRNTGYEFSLIFSSRNEMDLYWSAGLNFSRYKNEVLKLNSPDQEFYGLWDINVTKEGYPIGSFFGLEQTGLFQSVEEAENSPYQSITGREEFYNEITGEILERIQLAPGRMKFRDINGNDTIRWEEDRIYLGSPHPDFFFGIPLEFKYKKWSLNIFCYGSFGNEIYNNNKYLTDLFWFEAGSTELLKSWGMPGVDNSRATIPKVGTGYDTEDYWNNNSYFVEDASFLRIQQVNLGYDFSPNSPEKNWNIRVYFQANNILTLTGYSGFDPNFGNEYNDDKNMGWEEGQYPSATSYMIGANIDF